MAEKTNSKEKQPVVAKACPSRLDATRLVVELTELKIDKSFVADIAQNLDDRAIAQTILAMSQTLGFSVVAEGIETQEQLDVLRDLGCNIGQGYLFATPLSAEELVSRYGAR